MDETPKSRFIGHDIGRGGEDRRGRILIGVDEIAEVPSILLDVVGSPSGIAVSTFRSSAIRSEPDDCNTVATATGYSCERR